MAYKERADGLKRFGYFSAGSVGCPIDLEDQEGLSGYRILSHPVLPRVSWHTFQRREASVFASCIESASRGILTVCRADPRSFSIPSKSVKTKRKRFIPTPRPRSRP